MRGTKTAVLGIATAAFLAGCVSAPDNAPAWFNERDQAADNTYPSLRDVPRQSIANTDPRHWRGVEAEIVAAGAALRAHPRSAPASEGEQDPATFIEDARRELDQARDAHPQ